MMDLVSELVKIFMFSFKLDELVMGGIYNFIVNDVNVFLRVIFYEFKDVDVGYVDNKVYCFEVWFQISIFIQLSMWKFEKLIVNEIDKLMCLIGYGWYDL